MQRKHCPFSRIALNIDCTSVCFDDCFAQTQAQPVAAVFPVA